ncbi:MAG: hypothetical protein GC206_02550 [Alphaproteobacteria bacterium]|nr:hypothetical protein [Alphaproteobacteria bacterium]
MHLIPPPFDLRAAWEHVAATVHRIAMLFGDPVALRDQQWLALGDARVLLGWLRPLEALLRRLLLLEAVRCAPPPRRLSPRDPARFAAIRAGAPRRAFRILPYTHQSSGAAPRREPADPSALVASRPFALRFNAIVCALNRPAPIIARLARRLYARDRRALAVARLTRRDRRAVDPLEAAAASAAEFALADFLDARAERAAINSS